MNGIRAIQELNKRELENGVSPEASWHADYRDTAYIYIGGLPFELSEGDIITIFSQFGEPTFVKLVRDKETGKSRGFAFLKYEDQRSTDLAVDNLGGAVIMGRTLKVDHTRYKKRDDEEEEEAGNAVAAAKSGEAPDGDRKRRDASESESESEEERPMLPEERELAALIRDHDEDDPMKSFLIEEKKEQVAAALAKLKHGKRNEKSERSRKHRHHHRSSRRDRDEDENERHSRHRRENRRRSHSSDERHGDARRRDEKSRHHRSSRHERETSEEHVSRRRDRRHSRDRSPR
ncbi:RNA binding domain-containing protein [Xylogone sp. PMI_703]|nr:RNA binding domain-containing protein [Xylogone sp. PMI_703]